MHKHTNYILEHRRHNASGEGHIPRIRRGGAPSSQQGAFNQMGQVREEGEEQSNLQLHEALRSQSVSDLQLELKSERHGNVNTEAAWITEEDKEVNGQASSQISAARAFSNQGRA